MLLNSIFSILFVSLVVLFFVPSSNRQLLRHLSLFASGSVLVLSCLLLDQFDPNSYYFQYVQNYKIGSELLNLSFSVGLDGISLFFFILSNFLIFLCVLFVWEETLLKEYLISLILIDLLLLLVFSVLDVLLFYIFFEAILIPMYLMIGIWGSRERKIRAVYLFFFTPCLVRCLCL